jgi:hypothetical protein
MITEGDTQAGLAVQKNLRHLIVMAIFFFHLELAVIFVHGSLEVVVIINMKLEEAINHW